LAAICIDFNLFPPENTRWSLGGLIAFVLFFLKSSIYSGMDVVRRAYDPRLPLDPAMIEYPLSLTSSAARTLFIWLAALILISVLLGLVRILKGPTGADRMLAAQLLGTGGVGDAEALQAGRIYMVLVVVGEVLLFAAFIRQTWSVDSLLLKDFSNVRPNGIVIGLILGGFGIKAGALPVHVWLPLAHPAAPTPASAVLSGTMIKAGLLGWLRFLPIGPADNAAMGHSLDYCRTAGGLLRCRCRVDATEPESGAGLCKHQPNGLDDGGKRPGCRMAANSSDGASGHRDLRNSSRFCKGRPLFGGGRR